LVDFWEGWCAEYEANRPTYTVTARVAPDLVDLLPMYLGERVRDVVADAGPADAEGWIRLTLPFESLEAARGSILGMGRAIEVLEPRALRNSVADFAAQIVELYSH
jgi:predicted DNA-binding transcriptional regulator YafY